MLLATGGGRRSDDGATDAQLLTRLRAGDRDAYTLLWQRHIALALHVARSYAPGSAEDLASESFLAVYRRVAIEQKGPENAFRPLPPHDDAQSRHQVGAHRQAHRHRP